MGYLWFNPEKFNPENSTPSQTKPPALDRGVDLRRPEPHELPVQRDKRPRAHRRPQLKPAESGATIIHNRDHHPDHHPIFTPGPGAS